MSVADKVPDWDLEQLEVIMDSPASRQLVIAGPGAGKSAVACQRIAYLIDEGIAPSRVLLISFTRTAVAELRDRIVSYSVAGDKAKSVRISTLDSHAWNLRVGFDDEPLPKTFERESYELSIERTIALFRQRQPDLCDFMVRLEHLIVDEAQDVVGVRAELVVEILKSLSDSCGVTILADPAQAIYGFTNDGGKKTQDSIELVKRLDAPDLRPITRRTLTNIHRVKDGKLVDLFLRTRKVVEAAENPDQHIEKVQYAIREHCGINIGVTAYESIPDFLKQASDSSMLVLFRWRADVLVASSYCSTAGVEHRIRMSNIPVVAKPWLGWLFGRCIKSILAREEFENLWHARAEAAPQVFASERRDNAWDVLHRVAAARQPSAIDLVLLRRLVGRSRPPVEFCYSELGTQGPIMGTIHASKGRESETAVLVMPHASERDMDEDRSFEEGRVYYVGATRARKMLIAAQTKSTGVSYLDSGRVYRLLGQARAQMEVGREGDIDQLTHLAWTNAEEIHQGLARCVGRTIPVQARVLPEHDYAIRLFLASTGSDAVTRYLEIGQFSQSFSRDLSGLWGRVDRNKKLKPAPNIPHLHLIAVGTVALSDEQTSIAQPPFNQSGFALVPVVKGFPLIQFLARRQGGPF